MFGIRESYSTDKYCYAATLLATSGIGVTMNTALSMGMGTAFVTGMAGYATRTAFNKNETFNVTDMLREGSANAVSGALSVFGGYLGGISGLRTDLATNLLFRKSDIVARLVVENAFTGAAKAWGALGGGLQ